MEKVSYPVRWREVIGGLRFLGHTWSCLDGVGGYSRVSRLDGGGGMSGDGYLDASRRSNDLNLFGVFSRFNVWRMAIIRCAYYLHCLVIT